MTFNPKNNPFIILIILIVFTPKIGFTQYYIEGQVDTNSMFKIAHLDILNEWDYFGSISDETVVKSVKINSDGTYSFKGYELSEKEGFYRIRYSKNEVNLVINTLERNYINFVFSNRDSIKIINTSLVSNKAQNRALMKYIEIDDVFQNQQSKPKNELNANMHIAKHKEYCLNEIQQNNNGLTNLFLLYSSGIEISSNPNLFKKIHDELMDASIRPQYYNSLGKLIHSTNYEFLEIRNKWLRNILIVSVIGNLLFLIYFILKRKSSTSQSSNPILPKLTNKEIEVLELIKQNKTNKEIASELYVSEATIKTHINNIYRKMNVKSRQEAINQVKT